MHYQGASKPFEFQCDTGIMNLTSDTFLSAHCIECDNAPTPI